MTIYRLTLVVLIKTACLLALILWAGIGLGPDEAQYWTWSEQLSLGYYSKPPGIAWLIAAGTGLFGNTELGVRAGALFLGALYPFAQYGFARAALLSKETACYAALVWTLSPLGLIGSFLAITDGGMIFFWILASTVIAASFNANFPPKFWLFGLFVACGALFKWPIYLLWFPVLLLGVFSSRFRTKDLFVGMLLSLLGLVPSLIWNMQHDFATFRHVFSTVITVNKIETGTTGLMRGNGWEFLGAQAVLLSPLLFFMMIAAFFYLWKKRGEVSQALLFTGATAFGILLLFLVTAHFKKLQGNWADFTYPPAILVLAWAATEWGQKGKRWLVAGCLLSIVMTGFVFLIPAWQSSYLACPIPCKFNPFRHNVGWEALGKSLTATSYDPHKNFLCAATYQTTSELSFYAPAKQRAYFLNLHGLRHNQFSYFPGLDKESVKTSGFFVVVENMPDHDPRWETIQVTTQKSLEAYFVRVAFAGRHPLFYCRGEAVKSALLFKCERFLG